MPVLCELLDILTVAPWRWVNIVISFHRWVSGGLGE